MDIFLKIIYAKPRSPLVSVSESLLWTRCSESVESSCRMKLDLVPTCVLLH